MFTREVLEDILNNKPYGYWKQNYAGTNPYKVAVFVTRKEKISDTQTVYTKEPEREVIVFVRRKNDIGSALRRELKLDGDTEIQYVVKRA